MLSQFVYILLSGGFLGKREVQPSRQVSQHRQDEKDRSKSLLGQWISNKGDSEVIRQLYCSTGKWKATDFLIYKHAISTILPAEYIMLMKTEEQEEHVEEESESSD